ncbi:DUF4185 domain-containing protein [Candidatus Bipolaricaulota bacterium]|nr:DUF4185 domain-containing protein [Candidatus Bipolaricaulota bacterium]
MGQLSSHSKWAVFFAVLLVAFVLLQSVVSAGEYRVEETTTPASLQSLINPTGKAEGISWLGADAATSVQVTPDRYVWLFGDTILGKEEGGRRDYSVFIHNTIGVTERDEAGNFTDIVKNYQKDEGKYEAIFRSQKDDEFYWPLVGMSLDSSLLVAASKVTTKDTKTFKVLGTSFFNVENPLDPPKNWNYGSQFLSKKNGITWGSALVKKEDWLYVFGQKSKGLSSKAVLTKIGVDDARKGNWEERLNFADGKWKVDSAPAAMKGLPGTSETTIQYNSFFGWYSLQIPPFSFDVHLYTAENLTGPWQDQGSVYSIPSPWSTEKTDDDKQVFSAYAAKSHPELAEAENEIVLTYNVNLNPFVSDLNDKLGDYIQKKKYAELYIPQFVSLEFQKKNSD